MSKKKVCIHCGSRNVEYACEKCAKRDKDSKKINNICFTHAVFLDVGTTLELRSALGLSKFKEHPIAVLCLSVKKGEVKGCALPVINAMKKELK